MRLLLIPLAFLLGALTACESPTAPCADRTLRTDTIGWVQRLDGTLAPITATGPRCITITL